MMGRVVKLGDVVELVSGAAFKSAQFTDDPSDIALVKGENVGQGEILWTISKYWPVAQATEYSRFQLTPNDVVLAMDRPWVPAGLKFAWIRKDAPQSLLVQRVARLRALEGFDQTFLRYIIASKSFSDYIQNIMGGTNVPHISGDQIRRYEFQLPSLASQQQIGRILGNYDDLIANNKRRIELLEQSARLLFKEWFVHLRYPGHEHDKIVNGVPEGWSMVTISQLGTVVTGKTPSKAVHENFGDEVPFIKTPDMHGAVVVITTAENLSERGANSQPGKTLPALSTLVSCIGSVGVVALNAAPAQTNQQINAIVPAYPALTFYNYFVASDLKPRLEAIGGGATMANVNKTKFEALRCLLPSTEFLEAFDAFCRPVFEEILALRKQSSQLAKARDLLLPRLMDGRISV